MHVHLFVNPSAGRGRAADRTADAVDKFAALGVHTQVHQPDGPADMQGRLRALAEAGVERVVVAGGDGTLHHAANALAGSATVLGLLPAGSGNDGAGALGIPTELAAACRAAVADPVPIDLIGTPNGMAVTHVMAGFGVAANERADAMRFPRGGLRYSIAPLLELPKLAALDVDLTVDGTRQRVVASFLVVANTYRFGQGMVVAPDADPTDGLLDVIVMTSDSKLALARNLPLIFTGRHVRSRHVDVLRGAEVVVESVASRVMGDGEVVGELPASFRALPGALLVAGARPHHRQS